MSGHGILEHLLEVVGRIIIEESAAHQETGMVINDQDAVDPPALAVFRDIRKITGIRLPHFPKGIFLEGLPVPQVWVGCRFQVMLLHKTLDCADADGSRDEGFFHKMFVDLGGIQSWESHLEPADFFDGGIWQHPGGTLIGALPGHKCVDAAVLVKGYPLADGFGAIAEHRTIRQGERVLGDTLVVGVPGRIWVKVMDDRCDEREPKLCHGGCIRKVLLIVVHKNILLRLFCTIMREVGKGSHTYGVWLRESISRAEYLLAVRRRIPMGLEEGFCKAADKVGSKIRIGGLDGQSLQERKGGYLHGRENAQPFHLLHTEKIQPSAQLGKRDGEALAESLHGRQVQEILRQDTQEKEQAIAGVGDDEVRKDGMGMAAGTDKAQNAEAVADRGATHEVHQRTAIVGMDPAASLSPTTGTGLQLRAESLHERIKQDFR